MSETIVFILWAAITICCMVMYHKMFRVVYFGNMFGAILKELVICSIISIILIALATSVWWVVDIILGIAILVFIGNQKHMNVAICAILMIMITIMGISVNRTVKENKAEEQNTEIIEETNYQESYSEEDSYREDYVYNEDYEYNEIENYDEEYLYSEEETYTGEIYLNLESFIIEGQTADAMAEEMINAGYNIVYLEDYDGYGFADNSLILQNYDIGVRINARYSESATISFVGLTTDMSLEEADSYLIDSLGAENISLPDDNAWRYQMDDMYYVTLYGAGEKGIEMVLEVFWEGY